MNDLELLIREAFDAVELPPEVRSRTLAAIDKLDADCKATDRPASGPATDFPVMPPASEPAPAATAAAPVPPTPAASPAPADPLPAAGASPRARIVRWPRIAAALAACLALVAVCLTGSKLYFEETAFVGIDVNPSLELGINRFDLVVSASAFNADGEALLDNVAITGKPYDEAVAALTSSAAFAPYLENDAFVEISVVASDSRQSDALRTQSDACLRDLPCEGSCHAVDATTREAAAAAGMGVGRYETALELLALDTSLTLEECASMSMRELRDRIAALGGDAEASAALGGDAEASGSPQEGHGNQNGAHGQGRGQGGGPGAGQGHGQGSGAGQGGARGSGQGHGQGAGGGQSDGLGNG